MTQTTAERVAALLGDDGMRFETEDGREFAELLEAEHATEQHDWTRTTRTRMTSRPPATTYKQEVRMMPHDHDKVYVTMTDKFMSGWGLSQGKINKLIFVCDSAEEAQIVFHNAESRGDMKHINMTVTKPYYSPSKYYAQTKTKEDSSNWYKPNYNWGR